MSQTSVECGTSASPDRWVGTAYVSMPEAVGWIARMRWPPGKKADISKIEYQNTAGLEGFILAALRFEEEGSE
jgi:hypothetical protein